MNEKQKKQFTEDRINLIKGCIVTDLITERHEDMVMLTTIKLKHPNGNEFAIRPYDWQQLRVIQTLWG